MERKAKKRNSSYLLDYRKLLVDGKQQKTDSELALELPIERNGLYIEHDCAKADFESRRPCTSRFGRIPTVTGEGYVKYLLSAWIP